MNMNRIVVSMAPVPLFVQSKVHLLHHFWAPNEAMKKALKGDINLQSFQVYKSWSRSQLVLISGLPFSQLSNISLLFLHHP